MKIGLTGTMSVGKTTLVKALSEMEQFKGYTCTTERSKYLNSLGIPLNHETTIEGQTIFLAERVIDGDAFVDYAKRFVSQYDHIFYISPEGLDIEDNGVRETDVDYRKQIDEEIQKLLLKYRPVVHTLKGSTEERIEPIIKTI